MKHPMSEHERTAGVGGRLPEWSLRVLLLVLVARIFVLPTLADRPQTVVGEVLFVLLLLAGLGTVARHRWALRSTAAAALLALVLEWTGLAARGGLPGIVALAASVLCVGTFTLLVLGTALRPGRITPRRIEGAVAAYLLIGVICGLGYELIELVTPGSLTLAEGLGRTALKREIGYFSFVTLTTLGYGDVTPLSPAARGLAAFEAVVGQLYPSILLGWMVASLPARRT